MLVLGLPVAAFLGSWLLGGGPDRTAADVITDRPLATTLLVEAALAALLLPLLWRRGWTPARAAGAPGPTDVLRGAGVWMLAMVVVYTVFFVVYAVAPGWAAELAAQRLTGTLTPALVVLASVWNPIFEEFLWLGYGIPALEPRLGLRGAVVASVVLRVLVHAYQGPMALVTVLPTALVFTTYYVRTRRLWPVVVAHVVLDALALSTLVAAGG